MSDANDFIEKLISISESRAGQLVGAMSKSDKTWLTTERAVSLHGRITSVIRTLQAAQAVIEANVPRPKAAEAAPRPSAIDAVLGAIVGRGAAPRLSYVSSEEPCNDPQCVIHGHDHRKNLS